MHNKWYSLTRPAVVHFNPPRDSHIHECVTQTGQFIETIGDTQCIAVGHDHLSDTTHVIQIDPSRPYMAQRIAI